MNAQPLTSEVEKKAGFGTFDVLGESGLVHQSGYVYEEFLPPLMGIRAIKTYKEMSSNDPIVASVIFAIDMFMRKVGWRSQKASEDDKGEADANFLEECMGDMSGTWPDFISEVNSMLEQGWSYFEILYKRRTDKVKPDGNGVSKYNDGKIGWRKFDPRSQDSLERWQFDDEGGIMGMWQRPAPDYTLRYIPIGKAMLFRTTSRKNNPEGKSVLRSAYRPWYFKKRIEEIEGIGVERDLAGLPMAEVPVAMLKSNASDDDKAMLASIKKLVSNVRRDRQEGVIWPQQYDDKNNPQYKFSLMSAGGTRQFDTSGIITRYEQRIAMTTLTDFILTGHDSTGSFALATSKTGMFQAALGAWLDIIADVVNNYAIPRLFRLNGVDGPYPTIVHDPVQNVSLTDLSVLIAALAGAGAQLFPDTALENHIRGQANLPLREDKDTDSNKEQELRNATLAAQIAGQNAAEKQAKNPQLLQQIQQMNKPLGKDPSSTPGAPTKTTGPVKSSTIPQQRRNTAGARVAANTVAKHSGGKHKCGAETNAADAYCSGCGAELIEDINKHTWLADACPGCGYDDLELTDQECPGCGMFVSPAMKEVTYQAMSGEERKRWNESHVSGDPTFWRKQMIAKLEQPDPDEIKAKLAEHYPKKVLGWVDEADWYGPIDVNLSDIKMGRRPGGRDPVKVAGIAQAIDEGKAMDPVHLVMTPEFGSGEAQLKIADGYHRTLGFQKSSKTHIPAYVARVGAAQGPWDKRMHDAKLNKRMPRHLQRLSEEDRQAFTGESDIINTNKQKPENQKSHKFKPAHWTHPNGHPRCVRCGMEQPINGTCTP